MANGRVLAVTKDMSQPIKERRYLCSELVSMLYEDRYRNTHEATANLEEISSSRLTLLSEKKLESGRPISLRAQGHDLYGVVESGVFDPLVGWYTEIKLDRLSRWHERLFVPAHFLALCASTICSVPEAVSAALLGFSAYGDSQVPEKELPG